MIAALFGTGRGLPEVLQSERTECGLACLSMVASFYGKRIDLNSLRRDYPVSARGAGLNDILSIANALGLQARPLRLECEELGQLQLPAILHWDMTHFVVLRSVSRKGIVIHDPAVGKREYSFSEVGRHFTGIAIECVPGKDLRAEKQELRSRLFDLFTRYPGFNRAVVQLFVLSLFLQLSSIGTAFYLQLVIDEGVSKLDADFLAMLAIGFFMLALTNVGMSSARASVQLYFSNQLGFQMAGNVFNHLMTLPTEFFSKRHVGDLVSRFGSIREIRHILTEDLITVVLDGTFALLTLLVMFTFNTVLASVVLIFVVLVATLRLAMIPTVKSLSEQRIVADAKSSTSLMENMRAIEMIKFYCRELSRVLLWRNQYAEQVNANVQLTRVMIRIDAAHGLLSGLENVLVIYLAALAVLDGTLSLGFLTAFVALKSNFSSSIRSFIEKLVQIRLLRLQLERVSDITCTPREFDNFYLPKLRVPVAGRLQLLNLQYSYPGCRTPVLDGINLDIALGEIVAITGPSGAGKSTLIKVMAGLLLPTAGTVRIDEMDIQEFGLRQFRCVCAGVLQSDQLLSGTLIDNITLYAEEVDHELLRHACRMARIDDFINALPMGYNSLIGDMGSIMSAGQGQRVLLARAFYMQPRLLFLDEATANLDPQVEAAVLQEIRALQITTVMITHRPAPLAIADRVLCCSEGGLAPENAISK
ncbi:MAG: peptidase domain-containing ABC transporter [Pseudomonadota bacterium]